MSHIVERTSCPLCGKTNCASLYRCAFTDDPVWGHIKVHFGAQGHVEREYLEGFDYELTECLGCGFVYQKFIGDDFLLEKIYSEWLDPEFTFNDDRGRFELPYYVRIAQEVMMFTNYFQKIPSELTFFDYGMGWSEWLFMARGFGVNVAGSELSQDKVDFAKDNGIRVLEYDEIPGSNFDLIQTEQVFEHVADPMGIMKQLALGVRSGGLIKVSVPNGNELKPLLKCIDWGAPPEVKNSAMMLNPLEHINIYSTQALDQLGILAGLEPVRIGVGALLFDLNRRQWKSGLKTGLRPIYRRYNKKGAYALFRKP